MTSMGRARIVLVVVSLVVIGFGAYAFVRQQEENATRTEAAPIADASADAHAKVAKVKPGAKKKAARGGRTQVTGRASGSAGGHGGGGPHTATGTHPAIGTHAGGGTHAGAGHPSGAQGGEEHDDHGAEDKPTPPPPHRHYGPPSGPSYESAVGSNNQHLNMGANAGLDLSDAQLSAPMSDGTFISECGAPDDMGVTVRVAIKMGRAVGVSVATSPHSANVANCIDHHVRALSWPSSPKMDSFVTTY